MLCKTRPQPAKLQWKIFVGIITAVWYFYCILLYELLLNMCSIHCCYTLLYNVVHWRVATEDSGDGDDVRRCLQRYSYIRYWISHCWKEWGRNTALAKGPARDVDTQCYQCASRDCRHGSLLIASVVRFVWNGKTMESFDGSKENTVNCTLKKDEKGAFLQCMHGPRSRCARA